MSTIIGFPLTFWSLQFASATERKTYNSRKTFQTAKVNEYFRETSSLDITEEPRAAQIIQKILPLLGYTPTSIWRIYSIDNVAD